MNKNLEYRVAGPLKVIATVITIYCKHDYCLGGSCPVGNDPEVINNGKFCGLKYEKNNAELQVDFLSTPFAAADYRSSDDINSEVGTYTPSIRIYGQVKMCDEIKFKRENLCGYWHALIKYYADASSEIPYNREYAKEHFGLVAFPAKYGESGKLTYIVNEDLKIYSKDIGATGYLEI